MGDLLVPVAHAMQREILASGYIQADETPVGVQTEEKKGSNHTAYFWQYGSPGKGVVFDFRMGRDREGPRRFLKDFAGILQTDGYGAYARAIGGQGMTHACCLAHARRKFIEARHAQRLEQAPPLLASIHEKLLVMQTALLPKSKAGEATQYTLSLWRKLTLFLERPVLELSTNLAENSMRPIAIGRKN